MSKILRTILPATLLFFAAAFAQDQGESVYQANCASCHQATGQGLPGTFPPLAGNVPGLAAAENGRTYLAHVVLYGLQGEITVDGQTYNGVMPPFAQLDDQQIADVLNYVTTAWENEAALPEGFEPFTAEEIAAERDQGLTPTDVHAERPEVAAQE